MADGVNMGEGPTFNPGARRSEEEFPPAPILQESPMDPEETAAPIRANRGAAGSRQVTDM
jgi:hypothetical protein